jgi:hypothetical protein
MKKTGRKYLILMLVLTLMSTSGSVCMGQGLEEKVKTFNQYYADHYEELIYIHTDKNHYLTGEPIRFKVYCLEKSTSKLSQLSKVAYVEVLDENNTPRLQAKIELKDGTGSGEVFIPTSISSGNFILRGYTRWMRNFGPDSFFHSNVTIINPFKRLGLSPRAAKKNISIKFFPESQVLIDGLRTNIVFDCRDSNGNPCTIPGKLISNDSLQVAKFSPSELGMGSFEITPAMGQNYHIELQHADGSITKHAFMPVVMEGLAFQVREHNSTYTLDIFCNDLSIAGPSDVLYYLIHSNGKLITGEHVRLDDGAASEQIDHSTFDAGINSITLFSADGKFLKQRHIFIAPDKKEEMIHIPKNTFAQREKAGFELAISVLDTGDDIADITISVSTHRPEVGTPQLGLDDYLLIGNDLNAQIFRLAKIFDKSSGQLSSSINNLLIAYAGIDTTWQSNMTADHVFIPEYRTPLIIGKMTHKITNDAAPGIAAYISIVGKHVQFNSTRSKRDGSLIFEMKNFYGPNEIVLQTDYTRDTLFNITIDSPFSSEYADIEIPAFDLDEQLKSWIKDQSQWMQVRNAYKRYHPELPYLHQVDTSAFYGKPDARYFLDDFTRFIVMEEVMREYVSGVNVRKNKDGFHFMVLDVDRNEIFEENPLMLLDGVPVFDANEIIALDPLKIQKIETIKRRFHKGYLDCRGIVSYTSYRGDLDGYDLNDNAMVMKYNGLQKIRPYYTPSYATEYEKRNTTPDFRNVLFWDTGQGSLDATKSNIEFFTSDVADTYRVLLNGLTKEGKVFSAKGNFSVVAPIEN